MVTRCIGSFQVCIRIPMSPSSQGHSSPHSGFYRKEVCKLKHWSLGSSWFVPVFIQGNLDVVMTWFMLPTAFRAKETIRLFLWHRVLLVCTSTPMLSHLLESRTMPPGRSSHWYLEDGLCCL